MESSVPSFHSNMESEAAADTKVFIGGLLPSTTKESLMQHMSAYGELTDCKIVLDKQTGVSKGYGFVRSLVWNSV